MRTRSIVCWGLVFLVVAQPVLAAVRGDKAMYVGGTITTIKEKTQGRFDVTDEKVAVSLSKKGEPLLEIPYDKVTSLEYGQKAGRRVGVAVTITIWALFSKKRKHYLTIGFTDSAGKQHGVVLELAKGVVRSMLTVLEAKTGKPIEYESEEARKNVP